MTMTNGIWYCAGDRDLLHQELEGVVTDDGHHRLVRVGALDPDRRRDLPASGPACPHTR